MSKTRPTQWKKRRASLSALLLSFTLSPLLPPALAQEEPPPDPIAPGREEIIRQLDQLLPALIGQDNTGLVEQLLGARMGKPIRDNLDPDQAIRTLFGRRRPVLDPDCKRDTTASGDPSAAPCIARLGEPAGQGAYTEFSWSKNLGYGDVKYLTRLADGSVKEPKPIQMDDEQAHAKALDFLTETLGVPPEEIVTPPGGAPLPVRTLAVGLVDEESREQKVTPIMKMVQIPRALALPQPLEDPNSGRELAFVPATGEAYVLLNDEGVVQAGVRNWMAMADSGVDPKNAKSRDELLNEIADAILADNVSPIALLGMRFEILAHQPERSPESGSVVAMMLPAVQISYAPVANDLSEKQQLELGPDTAGQTLEIPLVRLEEAAGGSLNDE